MNKKIFKKLMEPLHPNLNSPDLLLSGNKIKEEDETPTKLSEVDLGN
jgi:hypothetical protein